MIKSYMMMFQTSKTQLKILQSDLIRKKGKKQD